LENNNGRRRFEKAFLIACLFYVVLSIGATAEAVNYITVDANINSANRQVQITGVIEPNGGNIAVTLIVTNPGKTIDDIDFTLPIIISDAVNQVDQVVCDSRGNYRFFYTLDKTDEEGLYKVYVGGANLTAQTGFHYAKGYSYADYSSVFFSSRWWRGTAFPHGSTLDNLKRFMATDNKWGYIYDDHISYINNIGIGFQGAFSSAEKDLNSDTYLTGRAEQFEGNYFNPRVGLSDIPWGCVNNPEYVNILITRAKQGIDLGVRSFQRDEWLANNRLYEVEGCFCQHCMDGFRKYLKDTYSTAQLALWGITDINSFNYKTYLTENYGIWTNEDYADKKMQSPLHIPFGNFHQQSTKNHIVSFRNELNAYAQEPIELSYNNGGFFENLKDVSNHPYSSIFDYGIGETNPDIYQLNRIVAGASFATGLRKPQIISPRMEQEADVDQICMGIASAYAMGQYFLVPWDIYVQNSDRYYGTVEEYGAYYHFIRTYPFLFDRYEIPAKVGVLVKWSDINITNLRALCMNLFDAGVPFRILVANYMDGSAYHLNEDDFNGLSHLIAHNPANSFDSEDLNKINNSGLGVVSPSGVTSSWLSPKSSVTTDNTNIKTVFRAQSSQYSPKVIHLLNNGSVTQGSFKVTITNADFFGTNSITAVLYRPNENPVYVPITDIGGGKTQISIPSLDKWGIIRIIRNVTTNQDEFKVNPPWSGLNIGNPVKEGTAEQIDEKFTLKSHGNGLEVTQPGDPFGSDQISFVYQTVATPENFCEIVKIQSVEGVNGANAGLMVRETPASNAKFISVYYEQGYGLKMAWRDMDNANISITNLGEVQLPLYVKLENISGDCYLYKSADGRIWGEQLGFRNLQFSKALAGIYTATGNYDESVGVFAQLQIQNNFSTWRLEKQKLTDEHGVDIVALNPLQDIYVYRTIENLTPQPQKAILLVALYNETDILVDIHLDEKEIDALKTDTLTGLLKLPDVTAGHYIKTFLWNSLSDVKPITNEILFP